MVSPRTGGEAAGIKAERPGRASHATRCLERRGGMGGPGKIGKKKVKAQSVPSGGDLGKGGSKKKAERMTSVVNTKIGEKETSGFMEVDKG